MYVRNRREAKEIARLHQQIYRHKGKLELGCHTGENPGKTPQTAIVAYLATIPNNKEWSYRNLQLLRANKF